MIKFFLKRAALTIPTFFALMFVTFVAIRLVPGDPVEVRTGERGISPERLAQFRHELGLDQPVWKQFLDYVWQLLHGDFGTSVVTNEGCSPSSSPCSRRRWNSPSSAMLFAVCVGMPAGVIAALKRGSVYDQTLMGISLTGFSMPIFWWGLLLIMLVAERWGLTPVSGRIDLIHYYFEPVTGFMLIDSLLSDQAGRVPLGPASPGSAGDRPGHRAARGHRAHDPLLHARGAERRLRSHRARQGLVAASAWSGFTHCATHSSRS